MCSDSESDYSASCSEEEEEDSCKETAEGAPPFETPSRLQASSAPTSRAVQAKRLKRDIPVSMDTVLTYHEIKNKQRLLKQR